MVHNFRRDPTKNRRDDDIKLFSGITFPETIRMDVHIRGTIVQVKLSG